MNVITLASRKGGAGKSTLAAHLSAYAHALGNHCLLIDADPQGSLALWHAQRADGDPRLVTAGRGIDRSVGIARAESYDYVFIDTAPSMWVVVQEAIRYATLVLIPARPSFFDLNAVLDTVKTARERDKPYAVVLNAAPPRRDEKESPIVVQARAFLDQREIPVWHGQISQRAGFSLTLGAGASATELAPENAAAASEIASLWAAIERSIAAINAAHAGAAGGATLAAKNEAA
jgi:cellulose biosynthesis protein BcsQ